MNSNHQKIKENWGRKHECQVGEGDLFKAPEWHTEEEEEYVDPMSAVMSRICLGEEGISLQELEMAYMLSLQRSGYSFTDFYYDSMNDMVERQSMHLMLNESKNIDVSSFSEHLIASEVSPNEIELSANNVNRPVISAAHNVGKTQDREEILARYRSKKNRRNYHKNISYRCRKTVTDNQKRIQGRFATEKH